MASPYEILDRKRAGLSFGKQEIAAAVAGASDGSWSDAQLGAFLMSCAVQGMSVEETALLTEFMLCSGEQWSLSSAVPLVVDKHSTGGVGDKVSLVLAPLLASVGLPVAMLTGRGLGHTGGTADKFEGIPGIDLGLDRQGSIDAIESCGFAIGIATTAVAPADRRLYALRNETGTVRSIPLVVGSILSKKLATGAAAVVFDVKTGSGAFFTEQDDARELAQRLVDTSVRCGVASSALVTDMGQPLGRFSGNDQELAEALLTLQGQGPKDLVDLTVALGLEMAVQVGESVSEELLLDALSSGRARETFDRWAHRQGASSQWLAKPTFALAEDLVYEVRAPESGVLASIDTMQIGNLLARAGAGRLRATDELDRGVSFERLASVGDGVSEGDLLGRAYLRSHSADLTDAFGACFRVDETGVGKDLILERVAASDSS